MNDSEKLGIELTVTVPPADAYGAGFDYLEQLTWSLRFEGPTCYSPQPNDVDLVALVRAELDAGRYTVVRHQPETWEPAE